VFDLCFIRGQVLDKPDLRHIERDKAEFKRRRIGLESEITMLRINEQRIDSQTVAINPVTLLFFQRRFSQRGIRGAIVDVVIRIGVLGSRQRTPSTILGLPSIAGCQLVDEDRVFTSGIEDVSLDHRIR
jgi:hypothetical protein